MTIINTVSEKYFSLNGINFAKIYQPLKQGSENIGIYNVNDTRHQLLQSTRFNEFEIDGVAYNSQAEVIAALLPLIYLEEANFDNRVFNYTGDNITNNITNNPDDEDLKEESGVLSFKDRDFEPDGKKGYKIIRSSFDWENIPLSHSNSILEIRDIFDMQNNSISIPSGVILKFNGGGFKNIGSINFNGCFIDSVDRVIFDGILNVSGKISGKVMVDWFGAKKDGVSDDTAYIQKAFDSLNENGVAVFSQGIYLISKSGIGVDINGKDNFKIIGEKSVIKVPDGVTTSRPFVIRNCDNVEISGIDFNCEIPLGTTSQPCNGLDIQNVTNCYVNRCNFNGQTFYGIGVYQDTIDDIDGSCAGLRISDCKFKNIGTIAIEAFPKVKGGSSAISDCVFEDCGHNITGSGTGNAVKMGQGFDESTLNNCVFIRCGNSSSSSVACVYYSKANIMNNTFIDCQDVNIGISITEHSLGVNGTHESLVISNNDFIGNPSGASNSNGYINLTATSSGVTIYDSSKGVIVIKGNSFQNTHSGKSCARFRPSVNLSRISFIGNSGVNLNNSIFTAEDSQGGVLINPLICDNVVSMHEDSTAYAIIATSLVGAVIANNIISGSDVYAINTGVHSGELFIVSNKFINCNKSNTSSRGAILAGTESGYTPSNIHAYSNVIAPIDSFSALILATTSYPVLNAGNVALKVTTNSTPTKDNKDMIGSFSSSSDAVVSGYLEVVDESGVLRKIATIS